MQPAVEVMMVMRFLLVLLCCGGLRDALTGQLILAVSDIRMMSSLERGCASAVSKLCPDIEPGSAQSH